MTYRQFEMIAKGAMGFGCLGWLAAGAFGYAHTELQVLAAALGMVAGSTLAIS